MKLSTRGRYGLRAMLELSLHHDDKPTSIRIIAQNQEISVRYLENIMTVMVTAGMAKSMRGKKGGFTLAKAPENIKASEIIQLLEGSLAPVACVDDPSLCTRTAECVTHDIWGKMKRSMLEVLEAITLADMVKSHYQKCSDMGNQMYHI